MRFGLFFSFLLVAALCAPVIAQDGNRGELDHLLNQREPLKVLGVWMEESQGQFDCFVLKGSLAIPMDDAFQEEGEDSRFMRGLPVTCNLAYGVELRNVDFQIAEASEEERGVEGFTFTARFLIAHGTRIVPGPYHLMASFSSQQIPPELLAQLAAEDRAAEYMVYKTLIVGGRIEEGDGTQYKYVGGLQERMTESASRGYQGYRYIRDGYVMDLDDLLNAEQRIAEYDAQIAEKEAIIANLERLHGDEADTLMEYIVARQEIQALTLFRSRIRVPSSREMQRLGEYRVMAGQLRQQVDRDIEEFDYRIKHLFFLGVSRAQGLVLLLKQTTQSLCKARPEEEMKIAELDVEDVRDTFFLEEIALKEDGTIYTVGDFVSRDASGFMVLDEEAWNSFYNEGWILLVQNMTENLREVMNNLNINRYENQTQRLGRMVEDLGAIGANLDNQVRGWYANPGSHSSDDTPNMAEADAVEARINSNRYEIWVSLNLNSHQQQFFQRRQQEGSGSGGGGGQDDSEPDSGGGRRPRR